MMMYFRIAIVVTSAVLLSSCDFQKEADAKFGDQHLKTAISLVELHKTRYGKYPESLADLKFIGDWDKIALAAVEYKRSGSGYELNVLRGWAGAPNNQYPPEFWQGLGVISSNAKQ
jgi:hypothetical protein